MFKTTLAVAAGKLSSKLIRILRIGSGTSLPGKVALRFNPNLLEALSRQIRQKTITITGTNGKSTTAGILSAFIKTGNYKVVHNQLGANMIAGITSALLNESSISGDISADYAVVEVDEASMPSISGIIKQDLTLVTNLFRDQLDRYGELDTTARFIQEGIHRSGGYLALNADDPMVTNIGRHLPPERVLYYGVKNIEYPMVPKLDFPVGFPKEVTDCPVCQTALSYKTVIYGHLGDYSCSNCNFKRPEPWLQAKMIDIKPDKTNISLCHGENMLAPLTLKLPGIFNAYNVIAAATAALWLNFPYDIFQKSIDSYHSIFGRAEKKNIQGKSVIIQLIKNPAGATEVLKVVATAPRRRIVIMINDNYADGRDISWLWDSQFEMLRFEKKPVLVSGHRAEDMALRLKYAGLPEEMIKVEYDIVKAFYQAVAETEKDETLYVLPTYTVLLQLSQLLKSR